MPALVGQPGECSATKIPRSAPIAHRSGAAAGKGFSRRTPRKPKPRCARSALVRAARAASAFGNSASSDKLRGPRDFSFRRVLREKPLPTNELRNRQGHSIDAYQTILVRSLPLSLVGSPGQSGEDPATKMRRVPNCPARPNRWQDRFCSPRRHESHEVFSETASCRPRPLYRLCYFCALVANKNGVSSSRRRQFGRHCAARTFTRLPGSDRPQALTDAISSHSSAYCFRYAGHTFSSARLRNGSRSGAFTTIPCGSSSFFAPASLSTSAIMPRIIV